MDFVVNLQGTRQSDVAIVGGKGARLGELSRIGGIAVPQGFCVTTHGFRRILAGAPAINDCLIRLSRVKPEEAQLIHPLSAELRQAIEGTPIPDDVASAITGALAGLGEPSAWAVRSSATAEDAPAASFAGQYDSYLNVVSPEAVLRNVSRCWASLFSERAVSYRVRNGFDHRQVQMAVVVQRMVISEAAGILFTADPVTGNRTVSTVDAGFGLGDGLVSGVVSSDVYRVRDGEIIAREIASKARAVRASAEGGTVFQEVDLNRQAEPALADAELLQLVELGRRIESHFAHPQDVEWCLVEGDFWILQSRPITTLFPVPEAPDQDNHLYVSVGHQQMMTEAMKPLGISVWQLTAMAPMHEAGGRLFVDVAGRLASPSTRDGLLDVLGRGDPLIGDALRTILDRGDFLPSLPDDGSRNQSLWGAPADIATDPAIVNELIERNQLSLAALKAGICTKSGPALFDFLLDAFHEHKRVLSDPLSMQALMAGMQAMWWLNEELEAWLGERNAADTLALSAPGNITAEMGLALVDVADVIRSHPDVVSFLQHVEEVGLDDSAFLEALGQVAGGREAQAAIQAYLEKYGMRCVGEIDITRPRWSESPTTLVPLILDNVRNFTPGEAERRVKRGREAARRMEHELLKRLRGLPDGTSKADEAKRMIERVRTFTGYREYPKYGIVARYFVYKQALLGEAERLVMAGALDEPEDIFYLTFEELHELARDPHRMDQEVIGQRQDAFRFYQALTPPRVLTSDGEIVAGSYHRDDVPPGALIGLPVSVGTVEGRARVVRDIAQADLATDDILVTTYTDPSWTPLFLAIKGLVTEVGGLMTHGAVIAREYGLPAVVGVQHATSLIQDGQRIRVNGTDGYIELLPSAA